MEKIDKRHNYIIVFDCETANTERNEKGNLDTHSALVYDLGWAVVDTKGNVYERKSYAIRDIYIGEREAMRTAYYADKLPQYAEEIRNGERLLRDFMYVYNDYRETIKRYGIKAVCAHNAKFDVACLNATLRYITASKYWHFIPKECEVWDSMAMARSVIHKMPTYRKFCEEFDLFTANGRLSTTAENLYRFISNNPYFEEAHKGLDDVEIERQIVNYCYRQHKPMKKVLYPAKG